MSFTKHLSRVDFSAHGRYIFGRYTFGCYILDISSSEISPSGCYTFEMFHLRAVTPSEVSPSGSYTFGLFTFERLQKLWKV